MLEHLHIENLAVIETADIDLRNGFSVLTGETGAGKSVLINSLNLILGERVGKDIVRSGCGKATVSALFSNLSPSVVRTVEGFGFDCDEGVLIQRELTVEGKTTVRINGRPATVSMLKEISGGLINIHGQHDNRALLDPATHVTYLDAFAANEEVRLRYEKVFSEAKDLLQKIRQINTDDQTRMQRIDLLSYQINEIDAADLRVGEEDELLLRREVLSHAEKIESALASAYSLCSDEDRARDNLSRACSDLENVAAFDPRLSELSRRMTSLCDDLNDLSSDLRDYLDGQSFDLSELDAVEERLDLIHRLKRKYGSTIDEILTFRETAQQELDTLNSSVEVLDGLLAEKKRLSSLLTSVAKELTESRIAASRKLEKDLSHQLAFLDMPNTGFRVDIKPASSFTPTGADEVEFLLSANLGETLRPLSKIASGGELSRIMLGMKTVLTLEEDAQTLIFDEVDTGVSGKAAEKIAMKLKEISLDKQVVVVTHLAQIAAYGDEHFLISKSVSGDRTYTTVTPLDSVGRVQELARIMGGINPTQATVAAAEDLLHIGAEFSARN